jgi:predicted MFS family arabinose efflux permease
LAGIAVLALVLLWRTVPETLSNAPENQDLKLE